MSPSASDWKKHCDFEPLLATARLGDKSALGQLLLACHSLLLHLAKLNLDMERFCQEQPEDLVQQTFLAAQRDFGQFQGRSFHTWQAWLCGIQGHVFAHWVRDHKHTQKRHGGYQIPLDDSHYVHVKEALADDDSSPSDHFATEEEKELKKRGLDRLKEKYRHIIILCEVERQSFGEIGRQLNCSAEAARKLWERAAGKLATEVKQLLEEDKQARQKAAKG